jgi:hypothetical protein
LAAHLVPEQLPREKTLEPEDGGGNPAIKNVVCTKNNLKFELK